MIEKVEHEKLVAFKYALENDIKKLHNINTEVMIRQLGTRRMKELFVVDVVPNGNLFESQQFEIFLDKQGSIHWGNSLGNFNEPGREREKVINV